MKIEPYKQITIHSYKKLDKKTIDHWKEMENVIKKAEEYFMKAQLAKDVDKIIKDFNEKGLK